MELGGAVFSALIGLICGIISGFGIGGGSLLMVWMTAVIMLEQRTAQAINLLYFIRLSFSGEISTAMKLIFQLLASSSNL